MPDWVRDRTAGNERTRGICPVRTGKPGFHAARLPRSTHAITSPDAMNGELPEMRNWAFLVKRKKLIRYLWGK